MQLIAKVVTDRREVDLGRIADFPNRCLAVPLAAKIGPADSSSFALVSDEFDMVSRGAVKMKGVEIEYCRRFFRFTVKLARCREFKRLYETNV